MPVFTVGLNQADADSLAQLAALLHPDYTVAIVDAIPGRMTWEAFARLVAEKRPRILLNRAAIAFRPWNLPQ